MALARTAKVYLGKEASTLPAILGGNEKDRSGKVHPTALNTMAKVLLLFRISFVRQPKKWATSTRLLTK